MTTDAAVNEADLLDQALATLDAELAKLPDEGDIAAPNARERIVARRLTLINLRGGVMFARHQVADFAAKLPALYHWRDLLLTMNAELDARLAELETRPPDEPRLDRKLAEARETLRIVMRGPRREGGEEQTPLLSALFTNRGVVPTHGRFFDDRAGLANTKERIAELEQQRDAARAHLDSLLAAVEQLAAVPVA